MQLFYIIDERGSRDGPYDLVSMIKKIRNGRVNAQDQVHDTELEETKPAAEHTSLAAYFEDEPQEAPQAASTGNLNKPELSVIITEAWKEFELNFMYAAIAGAGFFIITLLAASLSSLLPAVIVGPLAAAAVGAFIYGFQLFIAMKLEGQDTMETYANVVRSARGKQLLLAGALLSGVCFGVPILIAGLVGSIGYLFTIFGALAYGLFCFTPFIFLQDETNHDIKSMALASKSWILSQDADTIGLLLFLTGINFVAALIMLFPLFISLPVTTIALYGVYKGHFSRNI